MTRDNNEQPDNPGEQEAELGDYPFDKSKRPQPVFTEFEEDDGLTYEEPDRDNDYTSGFREDSLEEDDFDDYLLEEEDPAFAKEQHGGFEPAQRPPLAATETRETWLDEEEYPAEDSSGSTQPWPLGLIAVGVIALVLLVAGGYGVIQQRSETREEILQLQAALATAASPEDVNASRAAVRDIKRENARLVSQADALRAENRRLLDTVAGLEVQLSTQRAAGATEATKPRPAPAKSAPAQRKPSEPAIAKTAPAAAKPATARPATAKPEAAKPKSTAARPAPAAAQAADAPAGGSWFVNFSSYGERSTAQAWQARLKPGSGKVIIAPASKNGKTFYRVRVINLGSRESADKVARSLEKEYGLPKLWVGKQ